MPSSRVMDFPIVRELLIFDSTMSGPHAFTTRNSSLWQQRRNEEVSPLFTLNNLRFFCGFVPAQLS